MIVEFNKRAIKKYLKGSEEFNAKLPTLLKITQPARNFIDTRKEVTLMRECEARERKHKFHERGYSSFVITQLHSNRKVVQLERVRILREAGAKEKIRIQAAASRYGL